MRWKHYYPCKRAPHFDLAPRLDISNDRPFHATPGPVHITTSQPLPPRLSNYSTCLETLIKSLIPSFCKHTPYDPASPDHLILLPHARYSAIAISYTFLPSRKPRPGRQHGCNYRCFEIGEQREIHFIFRGLPQLRPRISQSPSRG